ncbi:hypothetical protein [Microbacterium sp. CPCC 204701]|uniref:hypothetical protein n=1 Tax=Microbacterium sp. CPCC 204701 TaxID=2493084 RepID=UPI001F0BC586|nr:hypothetical protein [Microbacterium sp. CPCC 204701]
MDTAARYENEQAVGRGIRESSVPREKSSSPRSCGRASAREPGRRLDAAAVARGLGRPRRPGSP